MAKSDDPAETEGSSDTNPLHHPKWEKIHPEYRDAMATFQSLGHILYWAGFGIAIFGLILAVVAFLNPAQDNSIAFFLIAGSVGIWLLGRLLRYVLSGR